MKDLTKELYFSPSDSTTIEEIKELFETLLAQTWTMDIFRNKEAREINLKDLGWTIGYSNARNAAGTCSYRGRRDFSTNKIIFTKKEVKLSLHLMKQNLGEGKGAKWEETIRHELAHAMDVELRGKTNHDRTWRFIAGKMLSNGERTFTDSDLADNKQSKYTLICDTCKKEQRSHKKKKKLSACGGCCRAYNGGRYSEKYVLRQVQNY